jgi:tetratricopeptide (TPR) repeat protein
MGAFIKRIDRPLVHLALICTLGLAAYSNVFNAPFQLDDVDLVSRNAAVRDLRHFIPSSGYELPGHLKSRYVGYLTFALNYKLHGLDVKGYHAVNLAVHILNALLVYMLVALTFRTPLLVRSRFKERSGQAALLAGLLFVSHPVQTEAVTYVFQRHASLAAFFFLLSLASYAGSRLSEGRGKRYALYALSILSAVLAMKTKENAFTLPVVAALYEALFLGGTGETLRRRALRLAPLLLTMLIVPLSLAGTGKPLGEVIGGLGPATRGYAGVSRLEYLFTQQRVIATYIRLLLFPVNQSIDYDYPLFTSFLNMPVLLSSMFILTTVLFSMYLLFLSRTKDAALRLIAFGALWFFATLSVESGVVPIPMLINEYRLYLPSAGAVAAVTTGAFMLTGKPGNRGLRAAAALLAVFLVLAFSGATYARNATWGSRIRLWEDTVRKSPLKLRPRVNLGLAYYDAGMVDEAISEYRAALDISPDEGKAHLNLALAYHRKGLLDKAIEHYLSALSLISSSVQVLNNLGLAYYEKGRIEEAIRHFQKALELAPNSEAVHLNLGSAYLRKGLMKNAEEEFRTVLRLAPHSVEAREQLKGISR